jgi:hypothetical protein
VSLDQLVRFLPLELTHADLNPRFGIGVVFMANYPFSARCGEALFVTDFVNLKIKPAQSFRCAYRSRVYMRMLIRVSAHTCIIICICTVFLTK